MAADNYIKVTWREQRLTSIDKGAPRVFSEEFPFDSLDDASRERAQADAHEKADCLAKAGYHPQLSAYRNTRGLSMRLVGVAA